MALHIALLRGINVGAGRRISMPELRALLEDLGFEAVQTYLQSGNVLLSSDAPAAALEHELAEQVSARFDISVPVIVRTRDELAVVVRRNPLAAVAVDPKRHQVTFLSAAPSAAAARSLSGLEVAPEQFLLSGREVFSWHPDGVQRSKLARFLTEQKLGVSATARNWRTVTQLLALADAA